MQTQSRHQAINQFRHRSVRDLAWVIASPPLVSGNFDQVHWWDHADCLREFENCLPALRHLDQDPEPLHRYLEKLKSRRLGIRFEALVAFWLDRISPDYTLLAHNIPLRETVTHQTGRLKGRTYTNTLGELDFLIQDRRSQSVIHLEVSVKFYLGTYPLNDPDRWFGTNIRDRLGDKLEHLMQRQTLYSIRFSEHLNALGYQVDERHCLLKGRLFYPHESSLINLQTDLTSPQGIAPGHLTGRWRYMKPESSQNQWVKLEKKEWFTELTNRDIRDKEIIEECKALKSPACYACVTEDKRDSIQDTGFHQWRETERLFCLPPGFRFPD